MSTSSKLQFTAERIQKNRAKFTRFRILVIGRANAGKTTILRRLCNTTGDPMIFSPNGEKIESSESALNPCLKRGEHDIKNQIVFGGNPGFVFHDSCGFEAGDAEALNLVQEFIEQCSKAISVKDQLHAIWYCIPTSDDRPITAAEKKFFNECGTGLVPVILLWTKTESLDDDKILQLMNEGKSMAEAMQQAPQKAWAEYEENIYQQFNSFRYPPKAYVAFRKMHEPGADCKDLIGKTTAALSSETLQQLFLSTQQNSVELCIEYGVKRIVNSTESVLLKYFKKNKENWACFMAIVLGYFPQFYVVGHRQMYVDGVYEVFGVHVDEVEESQDVDVFFLNNDLETHTMDSISNIMGFTLSGLSTKFNLKEATYCAIVAAIVGHFSFFLHQKSSQRRSSLERAAQIYHQSASDTSIRQEVEELFQSYHVHHRSLNPFKHFHVDQALVEGAILIVLNNLLSRI